MYWAQELANQNDNAELKAEFTPIAEKLAANESTIVNEMNSVQGVAVDTKGNH